MESKANENNLSSTFTNHCCPKFRFFIVSKQSDQSTVVADPIFQLYQVWEEILMWTIWPYDINITYQSEAKASV